jgi:hypothetical protein
MSKRKKTLVISRGNKKLAKREAATFVATVWKRGQFIIPRSAAAEKIDIATAKKIQCFLRFSGMIYNSPIRQFTKLKDEFLLQNFSVR